MIEHGKVYHTNFTETDLFEFRGWQKSFGHSKARRFIDKFFGSQFGVFLLLLFVLSEISLIWKIVEYSFVYGVFSIMNFANLVNFTFFITTLSVTTYYSSVLVNNYRGKSPKTQPHKEGVAWGGRTIKFTQNHVEITTTLLKSTWDWNHFTTLSETKNLIILHSSPIKSIVVSKRDFSTSQLKQFLAIKINIEGALTL